MVGIEEKGMDARSPRQEANLTDVGGSAQLQAPHE